MIGFGAFKRKPRQFSYKPVYYNPEKEERDARRRISEAEVDAEKNYVPGSYLRASRKGRIMGIDPFLTKKDEQAKRTRSIIRLVIFLFLLIILSFAFMKTNILEFILSSK